MKKKMSVLLKTENGWIVSHSHYLDKIYENVKNFESYCTLKFDRKFFAVNTQFLRRDQFSKSDNGILDKDRKSKKRKRSEKLLEKDLERVNRVRESFLRIQSCAAVEHIFMTSNIYDNNKAARDVSNNFYFNSSVVKLGNFNGANETLTPIIAEIGNDRFVFPEKCSFYAYDVRHIAEKLDLAQQHDFILMDPPWWNKFVRRKTKKCSESGYNMMCDEDLAKIPIKDLLSSNGIVAVWCTNAPSHLHTIINEMFPFWGVKYIGMWHWVKVTQSGHPICDFNTTKGKQPFELLLFGKRSLENDINFPDNKLIVSVPSCVHSHKPPVAEIVKPYLKKNPKCLEIFARYLLPGWTSWGLEVLKFQHLSLYEAVKQDGDNFLMKM